MKVLVTGAAGFIGSAVTLALLKRGATVTAIDNFSDYYDVALKKAWLDHIENSVGGHNPVALETFIETLEDALGKNAEKIMLPLQPGDVPDTFADVQGLVDDFGWQPTTGLDEGIREFVAWYRAYYT